MKADIARDLFVQIGAYLDSKKTLNHSLLGGDLGCVIYLYCYLRKFEDNTDMADNYLERILKDVARNELVSSYCNGLAGLGAGLILLENKNLISGVKTVLPTLNKRLLYLMEDDMQNANIDFLHGIVGIAFYFLKIVGICNYAIDGLKNIIEYLYDIALKKEGRFAWIFDKSNELKMINISLSHGIASMVILFSKMSKLNLDSHYDLMVKELLSGSVNFLLAQELDFSKYGSHFPVFPVLNGQKPKKSRLAWCYGDLGIGVALMMASKALNNQELYTRSIFILELDAKRRGCIENGIYDANLCHGAAGVSLIFKRLYFRTNNNLFFKSYKYWQKIIFVMLIKVNELMTFPAYNVENPKWKINYGILDGLSGVGLYLIDEDELLGDLLLIG